jgi:hypothetical protein
MPFSIRHSQNAGPGNLWQTRACAVAFTAPGLHPEHPTAVEGCRPVSRGLTKRIELELVTRGVT